MSKKRQGQLEKTIQTAIQEFLQLQEDLGRLVYQKNNTGAVRINRPGAKSSFVRFGKTGSPDFLVWLGRRMLNEQTKECYWQLETFFIEVKTDVGTLSPGQEKFRDMIEKFGGKYHVVRSFDDVKKLLLGD